MQLSPAQYIIYVFGGVRKAGLAIGRSAAAISKWNKSKKNKGTDGRIPGPAQMDILNVAMRRKLDITADDLIHGRKVTV